MDFSPSWQDGGGAPGKNPAKHHTPPSVTTSAIFPLGSLPPPLRTWLPGALGALQDAVLEEATN